jgi:hypothetical protein
MEKISKATAGYVHFEKTDYQCGECYKFNPDRAWQACAEVQGLIKPFGGCNQFIQGDVSQVKGITLPRKLSKEEAGYAENKAGFSCKRCEYFDRDKWDCNKPVDKDSPGPDKGMIHPDACCDFWEKSPIFGEIV